MTTPARILMVTGDTTPSAPTDGQVLLYAKTDNAFYSLDSAGVETPIGGGGVGTGTVTSVAVTPANGVSGTVANPNTTPAISITLGAITPTSVTSAGPVTGTNLTGTNTGDQTIQLTGDVTGSGTGSFPATLSNTGVVPGTYTSANIVVDAKGRILSATDGSGGGGGGTGTVISVAATGANGIEVTGSPITIDGTLGFSLTDITPSSVAASGTVTGSNLSGNHTGTSSGINTGDQIIILTGDATNSNTTSGGVLTLSTVNANPGSYGSATEIPLITVDEKGRITDISEITISTGGSVTSVQASGGTTGLVFTGGPIVDSGTLTLSGILGVPSGGTGAISLTGYVKGTGTTAFIASATIPGADVTGNITGNAANVTGVVAVTNGGTGATTAQGARNALMPVQTGSAGLFLTTDGTNMSWATVPSSGTVTSVGIIGEDGISVADTPITTSGEITLSLGEITPDSVAATGTISADGNITSGGDISAIGLVSGSNLGGTNTGDQSIVLTGDATNSDTSTGGVLTLSPSGVSANTYGSATSVPVFAVDAKGRITSVTNTPITVGGTGTVTSVSVVDANGITSTVQDANTTPAITLILGAITPSSVAATGQVTGSNLVGTNTGDQTITLTGAITGSGTGSFATTYAGNLPVANLNSGNGATAATFWRGDGTWATPAGGAGTVTSVGLSGGTTGITITASGTNPITTSGNFTLGGTLVVANGGTGATTLTGYVKGNGTSAMTASATIPGADINGNITGLAAGITGTLGIANGGTGQTTANAALNALLPTQTGQAGRVLSTNATTTSWIDPPAAGVASFSAGTTGLTPNSATTGAVTLAGTLVAANGGTGQTTYAIGDILYASTTTALSKLADVATGNALISGGVNTAPSWGKIGLTTHVSGTLPVANGGSGAATLTGYVKGTGTTPFTASLTIPATDLTGTLAIANGGTGASTAPNAINALLPTQTGNGGRYLTTNGTVTAWSAAAPGTVTSVGLTSGNTAITVAGGAITSSGSFTITANPFTSTDAGIVPSSGGGTANFLRADGTWAAPPGGGGGGVTQIIAGTGMIVTPAGGTGNVTVANDGVLDIAAGDGITVSETVPGIINVFNDGVLSITAGTGITITSDGTPAGTGNVTINATGGGGSSAPEIVVLHYGAGAAGNLNVADPIYSQTSGVNATVTDGAQSIVQFTFTGKSNPPKSITFYGQVTSSNNFVIKTPVNLATTTVAGGGTASNPDLINGIFTTSNVVTLTCNATNTGAVGAVGVRSFFLVVFGF